MQTTIVDNEAKCPKLPWMVDFHSTADGKILNNQLKAAFAKNQLEHMSSLHEKSKTKQKRLTQFIILIPPRASEVLLEKFLTAGMSVALLRIDYFTVDEMQEMIELIKKVNDDYGKKIGRVYPLAIALDISESEILTGRLQKPLSKIQLHKGQTTKIVSNPDFANNVSRDYIYVNYRISDIIKPGDSLIFGIDEIRVSAQEIAKDVVKCIVEKAGLLSDNLSVKIPNVPVILEDENYEKIKALHEKCAFDIIFVGPGKFVIAKEVFGPTITIFAKIEYASNIEIFDAVADRADGICIDGDKLMITAKETVFLLQKSIIANCNKLSKPVLATINCHTITKAQVSDIANTVIDGVDGLLLPPDEELLESVSLICKSAEDATYQKQVFDNLVNLKSPPIEPIISIAIAAVEASFKSNAAAIILLTTTGRTAKLISGYRPRCPVIVLTRCARIAKQLMTYRAIIPIYYVSNQKLSFEENTERNMQLGMTFGKLNGFIKMGDAVVIVYGNHCHTGFRNCMEVVFASEYDTIHEGENSKFLS